MSIQQLIKLMREKPAPGQLFVVASRSALLANLSAYRQYEVLKGDATMFGVPVIWSERMDGTAVVRASDKTEALMIALAGEADVD